MRKTGKRSGKGFYIIAAALLLTIGAATRLTMEVESPTKPKQENKNTSSVTSAIEENQAATKPETKSELDKAVEKIEEIKDEAKNTPNTESQPQEIATEEVITFGMPLKGKIAKRFSLDALQYSETYGDMRVHTGIDIVGEEGTPIKASGKGTVKEVTEDPLLGKTVVISHSGGIESYYCGLTNTTVEVGEEVEISKIIGTLGEIPCECLDQSHLHFAMKKDDNWVSPLAIMGLEK